MGSNFELDFNLSPWLFAIAIPIAFFLTWLMYRKTKEMLPAGVRYFLNVLRFVIFLIIAFLLLEPLFNTIKKLKSPAIIAVLHDNSESLAVSKDSSFIKNQFPEKLQGVLTELSKGDSETKFYSFANQLKSSDPDSINYSESGTDLSRAMGETRKAFKNQNLGAIVLVSDGIGTSGANPLYTVEGSTLPVYTVLLGDTSQQKDVKLGEVLFNEIAYLKNISPIKVKIKTEGYRQGNLKISLKHKGKVLGEQQFQISPDNLNKDLNFMITPEEPGIQRYDIAVSSLVGEATYRNNFKSIFINVLETKVKIAIFAGSPHPDLGALHKTLEGDDRYEVFDFVHKKIDAFYESPGKYNLSDFDLLILHNFPYSSSDAGLVKEIVREIRDRNMPVMAFMGLHTDLTTAEPLFQYLGIAPGVINKSSEEVIVTFNREYPDHSTFTFEREWINLMNSSPPIFRNRSDWRAKSDAKVFATATIKGVKLDYPVFALQDHLGRKNMVFVGENIWRTRAYSFVEKESFEDFDGWIFNLIQWLMVREDKRKFKVRPTRYLYSGSDAVIFKGQAYDDSFNPVTGAEIKVSVKDEQGKENIYYLNESGEAQYFQELSNLGEGTYSYAAEGKKGDIPLGTDAGQFSVGKSNIEHFRLRSDQALMEQIALRTKGKFYFGREIEQLAKDLQQQASLKPVVDYKKSQIGFQEIAWILGVLILLLAIEWVVRKIFSLI